MPTLRLLLALAAVLSLGVAISSSPARAGSAAPSANPPAPAQQRSSTAGGTVEQIGFGTSGMFQPTGWVPMKVRVSPPGAETGLYLIRVHQRDLDGDQVVYQRSVTLTGGMPNQEFWTYFKPQPVNPLDDVNLRKELRVVLADSEGRELAQLAINTRVLPLYSGGDRFSGDAGRGKRMVLLVSDPGGGVFVGGGEYERENLIGLTEALAPVQITTNDLPDRMIGYDGVDTIVWEDADPAVLLQGGGERMIALRQWISRGGKLVVSARSEWQTLEPLFDLLPVTPTGAVEREDLVPLASIVQANRGSSRLDLGAWEAIPGPFRFTLSEPKPDAIVENWFSYDRPSELGRASGEAPLIARRPEGFGSVTWIGIDLSASEVGGRPNLRPAGWPIIWNHLLGLGDRPTVNPDDAARNRYDAREFRDLGYSLLPGSRLAGRSVALVTVAMIFFIVYWLIAGPGLYFYLAAKRRTPMSWFFFGIAAVVATFVTLGVVKLILRGPPDLRHVSIVRQGMVAPQTVHSEMGLYIPEDGSQRMVIDGGVAGVPPTLTGFSIDPTHHRGAAGRSNPISYVVSLDPPDAAEVDDLEGSATVVNIPYRSTLKKLEADWTGPVARGIDGRPRLIEGSGFCEGRLLNVTGQNLVNVHIAFRRPTLSGGYDVWVIFLPRWPAGQSIEGIDTLLVPEDGPRMELVDAGQRSPSQSKRVYGRLEQDWPIYWYRPLRSSTFSATSIVVDDWGEATRRTPAMLSFFSLLPPMENPNQNQLGSDSTVPLRGGAHEMDVSAALVAGNMVIIAEAEEVPLPLPLEVDGDAVEGAGRIIYQFVLPLDRSVWDDLERRPPSKREDGDASTQPATEPATEPADGAAEVAGSS